MTIILRYAERCWTKLWCHIKSRGNNRKQRFNGSTKTNIFPRATACSLCILRTESKGPTQTSVWVPTTAINSKMVYLFTLKCDSHQDLVSKFSVAIGLRLHDIWMMLWAPKKSLQAYKSIAFCAFLCAHDSKDWNLRNYKGPKYPSAQPKPSSAHPFGSPCYCAFLPNDWQKMPAIFGGKNLGGTAVKARETTTVAEPYPRKKLFKWAIMMNNQHWWTMANKHFPVMVL